MPVRLRLAALAAPLLLGACAADGVGTPAAPGFDAPAARGLALARRQCGACHALGADGASRQPMAPPFRQLALRYNAIGLKGRLAEIASDGRHGEMPPIRLEASEIDDLTAYVVGMDDR